MNTVSLRMATAAGSLQLPLSVAMTTQGGLSHGQSVQGSVIYCLMIKLISLDFNRTVR